VTRVKRLHSQLFDHLGVRGITKGNECNIKRFASPCVAGKVDGLTRKGQINRERDHVTEIKIWSRAKLVAAGQKRRTLLGRSGTTLWRGKCKRSHSSIIACGGKRGLKGGGGGGVWRSRKKGGELTAKRKRKVLEMVGDSHVRSFATFRAGGFNVLGYV